MTAEPVLTTPTPRTLCVHDDLTDVVRASHGDDSDALRQVGRLFEAIRAEGARIVVLSLAQQIDGLVTQGRRPPFDVPKWIRAWFPLRADHVTACGRALRAVLEAPPVPA
jgi:hypothetical protein